MYFCKGVCSRENIIIQTEKKTPAVTRRGRYSMEVNRGDGAFNVTMKRLKMADAGSYHCGVGRAFNVLYQEVNLIVLNIIISHECINTCAHTLFLANHPPSCPLKASIVPPGSRPSTTTTLQNQVETLPQGSFQSSTAPSPAVLTLPTAEEKTNQQVETKLTDTTVVIIVSVSLAVLVCAIIPLIFYGHCRAEWTVEDGINTEGFERGEVSFQCSHNFARKNHKYFCKDPCTATTDILATVKSGERVKSGRITLADSGNGVFTVTFSQLQLSDSGKYWCAVDRPGFDTFTAVHVTVKEAPNSTNGVEQNINTGTVWYIPVGLVAVALLTILMLVIYFRKCRTNSKPQQQVCSNGTDLISADERECPPTPMSTAAECSVDQIYENTCYSRGTAYSKHSVQEKHNITSTMCRTPLPPAISERSSDGALGKHANKPTAARNVTSKPKKSRTSDASAALISVKSKAVVGVEGQRFDFRCEYKDGQQNNTKYFCYYAEDNGCVNLIRTEEHNEWVENGRFSLYDNTSRAFFIVRVKKLILKDSRTYWCGVDIRSNPDEHSVIHLNVSPGLRETEAMSVTGEVGETVTIKCSHANAFSNVKYFCKGACRDEDVLISSRNTKKGSNDKYTIRDEGNTFIVTVSRLTEEDSGTYWCGIERVGVDTYNKVVLTVIQGKLVYIGAGLGVVVLALAVVILIFLRHRRRNVRASSEKVKDTVYATPFCQKQNAPNVPVSSSKDEETNGRATSNFSTMSVQHHDTGRASVSLVSATGQNEQDTHSVLSLMSFAPPLTFWFLHRTGTEKGLRREECEEWCAAGVSPEQSTNAGENREGNHADHDYEEMQMQNQQAGLGDEVPYVSADVKPPSDQPQYATVNFQKDSVSVSTDGNALPDMNKNCSSACDYSSVSATHRPAPEQHLYSTVTASKKP
ncbi:CMRF35-like molecule 5 [Nibea albiflora]|uniref:CMRF35-like molecule 5 n=1 Tax=Nibea albiflora TaxID=240163 RepID=A0ACB7FLD3_NIBAL|nr:CMRF35-like molecule 5 [Nibea albiflora]